MQKRVLFFEALIHRPNIELIARLPAHGMVFIQMYFSIKGIKMIYRLCNPLYLMQLRCSVVT